MSDFLSAWAQFHPNCNPVSYELKHAEPDRWLRFHYEPASPTMASIAEQRASALHVMTTAATAALGDGAECWISGLLYSLNDTAYADQLAVLKRLNMSSAGCVQLPDDDNTLDIYAALASWAPKRYDDVFMKIENDEVDLFWMNSKTGAVFAPYDRGVDLILSTPNEVSRLAYEYSNWLSSYPGGW